MKATLLREFGDASKLELVEAPIPEPADGEVLIEVAYAGVLYADVMSRAGVYQRRAYELPVYPGHEVVGTVVKVGKDVEGYDVGTRVSAELPAGGGYSEYATASPRFMTTIPDGVAFKDALVYSFNLPAAHLVYHNFVTIKPDATVLIHSAAGGMGGMLVRIAKEAGNTVIGLVSGAHKVENCLSYGADHVIDTSQSNYPDEVLRITGGRGADVIVNHRGGRTLGTDLQSIAFRGTWIFINMADMLEGAQPHWLRWYANKCPIIARTASATLYGTDEHQVSLNYLHNYLKTNPLEGPTRIYSLEELPEAQRWMESGQSFGKLAIEIKGE